MSDLNGVRGELSDPRRQKTATEPVDEVEQKTLELAEFRDAGVLTEAEFEEQKAKLRWGIN